MSKFLKHLSGSNHDIRATRAQSATKQASSAQDELISGLLREVSTVELEIENHSDIAPAHSTQLRLENFNGQAWVTKLQELKLKLIELQVRLQVAKDTRAEWFGEDTTKQA